MKLPPSMPVLLALALSLAGLSTAAIAGQGFQGRYNPWADFPVEGEGGAGSGQAPQVPQAVSPSEVAPRAPAREEQGFVFPRKEQGRGRSNAPIRSPNESLLPDEGYRQPPTHPAYVPYGGAVAPWGSYYTPPYDAGYGRYGSGWGEPGGWGGGYPSTGGFSPGSTPWGGGNWGNMLPFGGSSFMPGLW